MRAGGLELEDIPPVLGLRIVSQERLPGLRDLLLILQPVVRVQEYLQRRFLRLPSVAATS